MTAIGFILFIIGYMGHEIDPRSQGWALVTLAGLITTAIGLSLWLWRVMP